MHRTTERFWRRYSDLPKEIRKLADKSFELLKTNSGHPSLRLKKVGDFWSARVGLSFRALAVEDGVDLIWVWIGSHDEYEQIIGRGN
jgi:mRNA-degrading endonuclease RelE of RelBE toxin-antitoxin system